ncbi:hypothetical protein D3C76_1123560 [compost metagenome]
MRRAVASREALGSSASRFLLTERSRFQAISPMKLPPSQKLPGDSKAIHDTCACAVLPTGYNALSSLFAATPKGTTTDPPRGTSGMSSRSETSAPTLVSPTAVDRLRP